MELNTWIKICGLTRREDALAAAEAGADAIGLVFAESPRRVTPEAARRIVRDLPTHVLRIGVFVDETPAQIARVVGMAELDRVQLHGFEDPTVRELVGTRILKAFRAQYEDVVEEIQASGEGTFLLDTWSADVAGGTGRTFDWKIAQQTAALGRLILAGGLTAENVGDAILAVRPFGVDVSSGVEDAPGLKNPDKIRAFVAAVRAADVERRRTSAGAT
ncbi:MAG: N-(5'-phosphoribosyl)anthranilate isomerase [Gemmatimonadota bacterium]|nr:MAG: N-(5'-phosphoribosyl)anthranilate isomerase [Gemmatimonadota bacterium]